jgi:hypothetical protein
MKLSRIIELALIHYYGAHAPKEQFMCVALNAMRYKGMIDLDQFWAAIRYIRGVVHAINPEFERLCLVNALHDAGYIPSGDWKENMPYTTQFYVWLVFDLKNKRL